MKALAQARKALPVFASAVMLSLAFPPANVSLLVLVALPRGLWGQKPIIVKMATLAPEGSPWHQVLLEIRQDWRDITDNKVRLKIYAGGTVGDESDMVR
ncbi:MAG: TRAP transporter substrate-binding protein DctP, partial [Armatimonadetes bacterium]|nr:TRAP transporter substrate-binding protein DctP [Armatimonadota bacterium]